MPSTSSSGTEKIVQTLAPRSAVTGSSTRFNAADAARPGPLPASAGGSSQGSIDLMDLPAAGSSRPPQSAYQPGAIRLVSGTEEIKPTTSPSTTAKSVAEPGVQSLATSERFGYDPNYGWLRGKLEYSSADRRWKLRYIPVDGSTDKYGGSVILADKPLLSGYERGDYVEVAGKLTPSPEDKRSFAASYEIQQIQRQAK